MFDWLKRLFNQGKQEKVDGEQVGKVIHYFPKPKVAVIKIQKGKILVGDMLHFHGHTTNFKQKVDSLEIDHKTIQEAARGREVGMKVKARVRPHDIVYKV